MVNFLNQLLNVDFAAPGIFTHEVIRRIAVKTSRTRKPQATLADWVLFLGGSHGRKVRNQRI